MVTFICIVTEPGPITYASSGSSGLGLLMVIPVIWFPSGRVSPVGGGPGLFGSSGSMLELGLTIQVTVAGSAPGALAVMVTSVSCVMSAAGISVTVGSWLGSTLTTAGSLLSQVMPLVSCFFPFSET